MDASTGLDLSGRDWSFSAWVRPTAFSVSHNGILGTFISDQMYGFSIVNGLMMAHVINVGDAGAAATTNPALNVWTQVGLDIEHLGATAQVRYWCGGAAAGTAAFGGSTMPTPGRMTNAIAVRQNDQWFDGDIAEVAIWSSLLDSGDWASLGAGASPLSISPPADLIYMPICGITSPEPDYADSKPGTVTGGATYAAHPAVTSPCLKQTAFYARRRTSSRRRT